MILASAVWGEICTCWSRRRTCVAPLPPSCLDVSQFAAIASPSVRQDLSGDGGDQGRWRCVSSRRAGSVKRLNRGSDLRCRSEG
jgi:hypothetical protein